MLKQSLEIGINKLGIQFKKQKNFIDGCMLLMEQQQQIEQQRQKIDSLNDKYQTAEAKNFEQVKQLQSSKCVELSMQEKHLKGQLDQALLFIEELKSDKSNLIEDKQCLVAKEREQNQKIQELELKLLQNSQTMTSLDLDLNRIK